MLGSDQDIMYKRLKTMRVGAISKEPNWQDCINVSWSDDTDYLKNKEVIFQTLAGNLVHKNKVPLEISKMKNAIFVRTEIKNV